MSRRGPRYSEQEARTAIAASSSYAETLRRLGMRPAGGNHRTLCGYVQEIWRIPTDHFDPDQARNEALGRGQISLSSILVAKSTYSRGHLKARLFKEGLKLRSCEMCGQDEIWRDRRMALILDHVNGIAATIASKTYESCARIALPRSIRTADDRIDSSATHVNANTATASFVPLTLRSATARATAVYVAKVMGALDLSAARLSVRRTRTCSERSVHSAIQVLDVDTASPTTRSANGWVNMSVN